jgi:hypothetical protein
MRASILLAAVLAAAAPVPRAAAKDPLKDFLSDAKEKARASESAKAADLYGQALALCHRQADLLAEQEAAEAFREFLERLPPPPVVGGEEASATAVDQRRALAIVMGRLDPKRCGAFASAPCIAGELVCMAAERGDGLLLQEASAALAPHAKSKSMGLALLSRFAAALQPPATTPGGPADDAALEEVLAAAGRQSWSDLGAAAALELAARAAARPGQVEAAVKAAERLAGFLGPGADPALRNRIQAAAMRRLKDAPEEVRNVLFPKESSSSAAGGRGLPGGRGGEGSGPGKEASPLGAFLRKAPRGAVLGTMTRTKGGFELRVAWDPKFKGVHEHQDSVMYLDDGGLTVSVHDWAVALAVVDPVGTAGQPGARPTPPPGAAFYRVGHGESWVLKSDGTVAVGGK